MLIQAKADQARITSVCIKRSTCGFEAISRRRSVPAPRVSSDLFELPRTRYGRS
jgi:hypothetical protein